jgi:hypothetical protein
MAAAISANPFASLQDTPLLNIAAEQIQGREQQTGKDITNWGARTREIFKEILPPIIPPGYEGTRITNTFTANREGGLGLTNLKTGVETTPGNLIASYLTGVRFSSINLDAMKRNAISETQRQLATAQTELRQVTNRNNTAEAVAYAQEHYRAQAKQLLMELSRKLDTSSESKNKEAL